MRLGGESTMLESIEEWIEILKPPFCTDVTSVYFKVKLKSSRRYLPVFYREPTDWLNYYWSRCSWAQFRYKRTKWLKGSAMNSVSILACRSEEKGVPYLIKLNSTLARLIWRIQQQLIPSLFSTILLKQFNPYKSAKGSRKVPNISVS